MVVNYITMFEYNLTYLTLYHRENLNVLTTTVSSSATTLSVSSRIVNQWLNLVTSSRLRGDYQVIQYQDPLLSYFPFYPCSHLFFTLEFCVGVTFMSTAVLKLGQCMFLPFDLIRPDLGALQAFISHCILS